MCQLAWTLACQVDLGASTSAGAGAGAGAGALPIHSIHYSLSGPLTHSRWSSTGPTTSTTVSTVLYYWSPTTNHQPPSTTNSHSLPLTPTPCCCPSATDCTGCSECCCCWPATPLPYPVLVALSCPTLNLDPKSSTSRNL